MIIEGLEMAAEENELTKLVKEIMAQEGISKKKFRDDYGGIKVTFSKAPIKEFPSLTSFVFSDRMLLDWFLKSLPRVYEMVMPPMEFQPDFPYPVKATTPADWLDAAQLPVQATGKTSQNPRFIMDVGGRKIGMNIPSDRYVFDMGELPVYAAYYGLKPKNDSHDTFNILICDPGDEEQFTDSTLKAKDYINSRLGYLTIYDFLKEHYKDDLSSPEIVKACRQILKGERLPKKHAPVIPVMLAALMLSEVSRNRASLLATLMLFDLMESRIPAPTERSLNTYRFENILWHPAWSSAKSDKKLKNAVMAIGGFHPMAHNGSWIKEFSEGPYQDKEDGWSNIKSISILIQWLTHVSLKNINSNFDNQMQVTRLTNVEYEMAQQAFELELIECKAIGKLTEYCILNTYLLPLINQRFSHFDNMLNATPEVELSDRAYLCKHGAEIYTSPLGSDKQVEGADEKDAEIAVRQQEMNAEVQVAVAEHQSLVAAYKNERYQRQLEATSFAQSYDASLIEKIKALTPDKYREFFNDHCEGFKWELFLSCRENRNISATRIIFIIRKLYLLNKPYVLSLASMLLNLSAEEERIIVYKVILGNSDLIQKYNYARNIGGFIVALSHQHPVRSSLINVLLEPNQRNLLLEMSTESLSEIIKSSTLFFKKLLLEVPEIIRRLSETLPPYELSEYAVKVVEREGLDEKEIEKIRRFNYVKSIDLGLRIATSTKASHAASSYSSMHSYSNLQPAQTNFEARQSSAASSISPAKITESSFFSNASSNYKSKKASASHGEDRSTSNAPYKTTTLFRCQRQEPAINEPPPRLSLLRLDSRTTGFSVLMILSVGLLLCLLDAWLPGLLRAESYINVNNVPDDLDSLQPPSVP